MDKYKIIKKLSDKGDEGSVSLIQFENSDEKYVLKKISHLDNPIHRAIFDKEVSALSKVSAAPNIVKMVTYEFGKVVKTGLIEGRIILEYIDGQTLQEVNSYIESTAIRYQIAQQLITALRYAHENGIIHRDINPRNVMITEDRQVKLIDFGICKIKGVIQNGTTYQFATNRYAAPEVGYHSENASESSDIYSLGALLFFLFTNREPALPDKIEEEIISVSGIDVGVKSILQKMIATDPAQRYENIIDLQIDLAPIFEKYLNNGEKFLVVVPSEKFTYLRSNALVIDTKKNQELLDEDISNNFSGAYVRLEEKDIFWFDGVNYSMKCVFDRNCFQVIYFKKLDIIYRERNKRISLPVNGKIIFAKTTNSISNTFESFQLYNRVLTHVTELQSNENINDEYHRSFGIWKEFISIMIADARQQALKFNYDKYEYKDDFLAFTLKNDSCMGDESITRETTFLIETIGKNGEISPIQLGSFWGYKDDGSVMIIKPTIIRKNLLKISKSGWFCVDYAKQISQYKRQEHAMDDFMQDDLYDQNLKGIFSGLKTPSFRPQLKEIHFFDNKLDITQQNAVKKIIAASDIALIQGPPGTGKTNVIIEVIRQIILRNKRYPLAQEKILIVSQAHAAVDNIIEDLDPYVNDISLIRIGKDDNLSELARKKYSLDNQKDFWIKGIVKNSENELEKILNLRSINKSDFLEYADAYEQLRIDEILEADDITYKKIISAFLTKYPFINEDNLLMKLMTQYQWIKHINETNDIDEYFVKSAIVVAGTCSGFISNMFVRNIIFDYVIVDEAAKATFPELLVPIVRAKKVVMVGDHKQLPPVFDREAIKRSDTRLDICQLQNAGFGRLFETINDDCKETLTTQYRMHPCIGKMISEIFYDGQIQNGVTNEERTISDVSCFDKAAMIWISTSGLSQEQRKEEQIITPNGNISYRSPQEEKILLEYLQKLDHALEGKNYTIGVITPYRAQLELIQRHINCIQLYNISAEINTVDAFQGSQKDIIIYSTVRSSSKANIGFLNEQSRLNVSFSRAKCLLIIIGDREFLDNTEIKDNRFPEIIRYIKMNNDYCKTIDYCGR